MSRIIGERMTGDWTGFVPGGICWPLHDMEILSKPLGWSKIVRLTVSILWSIWVVRMSQRKHRTYRDGPRTDDRRREGSNVHGGECTSTTRDTESFKSCPLYNSRRIATVSLCAWSVARASQGASVGTTIYVLMIDSFQIHLSVSRINPRPFRPLLYSSS